MEDKPRLIEVAFPLKQASLASVHEKNVRHGHISTLHIWPARRPLAACRAALLATLLPDPGDPKKREELLEKIGGKVVRKIVETEDEDGSTIREEKEVVEGGVLAWGQENSPSMDDLRAMIKDFCGGAAPKVLDPFAGGGAIPLEAMRLGCDVTASDINPVAWFILKCTLDYPQQFAGKKWPLPDFVHNWPDFVEDFRNGKSRKKRTKPAEEVAPDSVQETIPGYGATLPPADLAWHVRAWGRWVLERARADLASRYPVINNEPAVAYLWARTARDKITTGKIPLLKTFWLCKKRGKRVALLPIPNVDKSGVTFRVLQEQDVANPAKVIGEYPFLKGWEVEEKNLEDFFKNGTMNRAGVWSPCSGRPGLIALTMDDLRTQGQQKLLGTQMTAVVVEAMAPKGKKTYKRYRLPAEEELKAAVVEVEELEEAFEEVPFGVPEEATPAGGGSGAGRAFSLQRYGLMKWRDLFTNRQLFALGVVLRHTRAAVSALGANSNPEAEAIGAYLSAAIDRLADRGSAVCTWTINYDQIRNTFARFALTMAWDFAECVPCSLVSGGYPGQLELLAKFLDEAGQSFLHAYPPKVRSTSAIVQKDYTGLQVIATDPPYYDAIPYSDLMDFFLVWLKRAQSLCNETSPKWNHDTNDGELIDDSSRFGGDAKASKLNYESGMTRAFASSLQALCTVGRLVIVFANKSVDAWEALIGALIRSGAVVTASWPIQTEREARSRSQASAALSSSVWIVCRKRPDTSVPGWDVQVLDRMRQTLFSPRPVLGGRNILQYYFDLGIRGPDFLWAALGPALEAYSAHPYVKKTEGGIMTVPEFLCEVRKLVLQFSLGELPGFSDIQKDTQGRGESLALDPVTQYYLLHRNYFGLEPTPAGACILYANACGKNETELKIVWNILEQGGESKKGRPRAVEVGDEEDAGGKGNEYRLHRWDERTGNEDLGESRGGLTAPLIDKLHRMMFLFNQNRASEVQAAFDAWGLVNDRAFGPLLQAVRELAVRDKDDTERRLVEALATQLRMGRRTRMTAGGVQEVSLFTEVDDTQSGIVD